MQHPVVICYLFIVYLQFKCNRSCLLSGNPRHCLMYTVWNQASKKGSYLNSVFILTWTKLLNYGTPDNGYIFSVLLSTVLSHSRCSEKKFFLLCKLYEDRGWIHLYSSFNPQSLLQCLVLNDYIIKRIIASQAPENAGLTFLLQPLWLADPLLRQAPVLISQCVFHLTFAVRVSGCCFVFYCFVCAWPILTQWFSFLCFSHWNLGDCSKTQSLSLWGNLKVWNTTARIA